MRPIGFSTGAIAKSEYKVALENLRRAGVRAVELSALRLGELDGLVASLPNLDLSGFEFVSFHAPSRYEVTDEESVIRHLQTVVDAGIPVVVHPDVMFRVEHWLPLGKRLFIENMDKRKPVGRTLREFAPVFKRLPEARVCFDIGHSRQVDPTMSEARCMLEQLADRLAEVHISEVNTSSRHDPISENAIRAFRSVAHLIPMDIPIVLESLIDHGQSDIATELASAARALTPTANLLDAIAV